MDANYYKKYEPLFGAWHITEKIGEGSYGKVYIMRKTRAGTDIQIRAQSHNCTRKPG